MYGVLIVIDQGALTWLAGAAEASSILSQSRRFRSKEGHAALPYTISELALLLLGALRTR